MDQQYPRSPWYDQTLPSKTAKPAAASGGRSRKTRKKRTGLRITAISVCVLVLIVASVFAFSEQFRARFQWRITTPNGTYTNVPDENSEAPSGDGGQKALPEIDGEGYAKDFRDFFSTFYSAVESNLPDSNLTRANLQTDFRLEPISSAGKQRLTLQELYAACVDSVVGIRASVSSGMSAGLHWGSGFIVSADGLIITNQHVISEADTATVVLSDGTEYPAQVVGEDAQTDVALLKIAAKDLPFAELGDSNELQVGDDVVAIGNPLSDNLSGTMTNGIISAIDRSINYKGHDMPLLQTNTAINEGNSGGPLFNMYGQVIGITNMKMSSAFTDVTIEGIGFAIPSSTVKTVTDALLRDGKYVRPGLGITVGVIPEEVGEHYALPEGLYISGVSDGSSAQEQGVKPGDILTHVNGIPVRETKDVLDIRDSMSVGDEMTLTLFRDGRTFDVVIVLRELSILY